MLKTLTCVLTLFLTIAPNLAHAGNERVRLYAFGNSLVHHLSDDPGTNVPIWLARMARADGRLFSMDGQWGFLRDFTRNLPPSANWSFRGVRGAWNPDRTEFGNAGFSDVIITPANFLQYQSPEKPFGDEGANGATPVSTTVTLLDWIEGTAPGTRINLYEGWADMGEIAPSYPPSAAEFARYNAYVSGDYHRWYQRWLASLRTARPDANITLIPVAPVLARLFTDSVLSGIAPKDLYSDTAPHGTATLYLLAAMVTYSTLFDASPPTSFEPPEGIHPLLRDNFRTIAGEIWAMVNGDMAEQAGGSTPDLGPPGPPAAIRPEALQPELAEITESPDSPDSSGGPETTEAEILVAGRNLMPVLYERPDTGLGNPALAMGLNGLADWSVQHPFIDIMKTARTWIGHRDGAWGAWSTQDLQAGGHLDEQGWPRSLPEGATALEALIMTDQPEAAIGLIGRYRVTFDGEGTLRVVGRASKVSVRNGEIWFSYAPGEGAVGLSIQETDPNGTGNNIRNIVVTRAAHIPLYEAGVTFNPDWLEVVDDLRAIRFMDWMLTNGSPVTTWSERPVTSDYTYTRRGVPMEIMVLLANEIGADPWFSMPHAADDTYVQRFAEYARDTLDPRLIAYVEYSNEFWNFIFPQTAWMRDRAMERWGAAAKNDGWMQYGGMRANQIAGIWSDVYGADTATRLKRVIAVHTGWLGLEEPLLQAPLWRAENPTAPPISDSFDAYAVSGYFGHELGSDEMAETVRGWMAMDENAASQAAGRVLRDGSLTELLDVLYPYHAKIAGDHSLELIMYEGGTHVAGLGAQVNDEAMTKFFTTFNYSNEMALLYDELLSGWQAAGGTLFNAFVDVARPSQYGSWGALRHLDDDNARFQVLKAFNAAGADWETRSDDTFLHGAMLLGADGADVLIGSAEEDVLLGGAGDDILVSNGAGDHLHGGDGLDMAILPGTQAAYRFTQNGAQIVASNMGVDVTLFAVELLQFSGAPGAVLDLADFP